MNNEINYADLINVLNKMFNIGIVYADFQTKQLYGGTIGKIRLVTGIAETKDGEKLPYNVVWKRTKKFERYGDLNSWRREYDLYMSELAAAFTNAFRWPICYHAELKDDEHHLWLEYIEGTSGLDLSCKMYERAAEELGRFQGKLNAKYPALLQNLNNLSEIDYIKNFYLHYRSWNVVYDYIRSDDCKIPKHLCKMIIDIDENEDEVWKKIKKLPVVLCHRDFWITNIFYSDNKITLIDWDTTGWGYLGEDIASLLADEADVEHMIENYQNCVSSYYKGFSEYVDISHITDNCVYELIIIKFGYRLIEWYINAGSPEEKKLQIDTLQKIYEMRDVKK